MVPPALEIEELQLDGRPVFQVDVQSFADPIAADHGDSEFPDVAGMGADPTQLEHRSTSGGFATGSEILKDLEGALDALDLFGDRHGVVEELDGFLAGRHPCLVDELDN